MGIVNSFIHDIFEKLRHWNYPQQQDMSPSNLLKCRLQTAVYHILAKHTISQGTNAVTNFTGKEPTPTSHIYRRLSI
jgi:hypothetical protein